MMARNGGSQEQPPLHNAYGAGAPPCQSVPCCRQVLAVVVQLAADQTQANSSRSFPPIRPGWTAMSWRRRYTDLILRY
jgi:hypothetical protein